MSDWFDRNELAIKWFLTGSTLQLMISAFSKGQWGWVASNILLLITLLTWKVKK